MGLMYILPSKHLAVFTFSWGDRKILIYGAGQDGPGRLSLLKSKVTKVFSSSAEERALRFQTGAGGHFST